MDVKNFPGLAEYLEHIRSDYVRWATNLSSVYRDEYIREFNSGLRVVAGSKFIKVISGGSVHSFICLKDNGKFVKGDILKAESYTSPARNFARGNTIAGSFKTATWTGA